MSVQTPPTDGGDKIRETYEENKLGDGEIVAMISDPYNEYAWIQSDLTVTVGR